MTRSPREPPRERGALRRRAPGPWGRFLRLGRAGEIEASERGKLLKLGGFQELEKHPTSIISNSKTPNELRYSTPNPNIFFYKHFKESGVSKPKKQKFNIEPQNHYRLVSSRWSSSGRVPYSDLHGIFIPLLLITSLGKSGPLIQPSNPPANPPDSGYQLRLHPPTAGLSNKAGNLLTAPPRLEVA